MIFFFFQAEDGIRDIGVTGVQTCALPIWAGGDAALLPRPAAGPGRPRHTGGGGLSGGRGGAQLAAVRRGDQIGRASGRERVEISVGAGSLKKKKHRPSVTPEPTHTLSLQS